MDMFLIILAGLFILVGLIGCFLPVIPGPPISYIGLLLLEATSHGPFSLELMLIYLAVTLVVTGLDFLIPIWGAKLSGGSKKGNIGATIGVIVGIFILPPVGVILFPFLGAVLGELADGKDFQKALKAGFGSFLGFLTGTLLKVLVSGFMAYSYVKALINIF